MFIYSDTNSKDVKMIQIGVETDDTNDEYYMIDLDDGHRLTADEFEKLLNYHVPIVVFLPDVLGDPGWAYPVNYFHNIVEGGYYSAAFIIGNTYTAYTAEYTGS